jgi:phosphohistidine swiveling domain-containing protein
MGTRQRFVISLEEVRDTDEPLVGGKAARLATLSRAGFAVPDGFCLTIEAYQRFLTSAHLGDMIRMELGRKAFGDLRWEEIWDASLRIRSAFTAAAVPAEIASEIADAMGGFPLETHWAVRSTAPGEDSSQRSFAGLHESYLGVVGFTPVLDAVRLVWASLWSDAAMLYRLELALDPGRSSMAVLLQPMRNELVSGVAFGRDPVEFRADHALIEAVPGLCSGLVDGEVEPDRWKIKRFSGEVLDYQPGTRENDEPNLPLLEDAHLVSLSKTLGKVESLLGWPPDVEWTGRGDKLTLLQARPITSPAASSDDKKAYYLTLRPGMDRLRVLQHRFVDELIPELEAIGKRLASEPLDEWSDEQLAAALEERLAAVRRWRQIYRNDFIPFAHGVRRLAIYYNDAVRPEDPYEFVGLLRGEPLLAVHRNEAIAALANEVGSNVVLRDLLTRAALETGHDPKIWKKGLLDQLRRLPEGGSFADRLATLLEEFLDIAYNTERLSDRPDLILHNILELARAGGSGQQQPLARGSLSGSLLEERLMEAVGSDRHEEAREVLALGRISWRLRDNDNLLLARLESQLLRAIHAAAGRLERASRLERGTRVGENAAAVLIEALRQPSAGAVRLPTAEESEKTMPTAVLEETPRQLVGQPAAPGMQTGRVRRIRTAEDLGQFLAGEVLVCDAIQPMMTHLVLLAAAVVERRGGMLIHGAIIARELGLPCVNGVAGAIEMLHDGDIVTVDGYLGIVTVGAPEFDLELADVAGYTGSRKSRMGV